MAEQKETEAKTKSSIEISPRERELYETMRELQRNEDLRAFLKYSNSEIPLTPVYSTLGQNGTIKLSRGLILGSKIELSGGRIDGAYLDFFKLYMNNFGFFGRGDIITMENRFPVGFHLNDDRYGYFFESDVEGRTDYIGRILPKLTGEGMLNAVTKFLKTNKADLTERLEETEKSQRELEHKLRIVRKLEAKYR